VDRSSCDLTSIPKDYSDDSVHRQDNDSVHRHEMKSLGASLECMKKQLTPSTSVFCFQLYDLSQNGNDLHK